MKQGADTFGCVESMIRTVDGYLNVAEPDPETITVESIARGLAHQFRYAGQAPKSYTVAEHSCLMASAHTSETDGKNPYLKEILLHDAAEAFLGDIPKPIKVMLPDYQRLERVMEDAIATRFELDTSPECVAAIKSLDRRILKAEKQALWPNDDIAWEGFDDIEALDIGFCFYSPAEANTLLSWWLDYVNA